MSKPERIGGYTIERELGRGGMGVVWLGRDEKLDRPVAIKVLSQAWPDEELRLRFEREARTAAQINHANIATIYEIGEEEGSQYISMEYVEGRTLRESIRGGGLDSRSALRMAQGIAEGLAEAHARGIVHRDLKPGNVIVTPAGVPKLLDFGLAKPMHATDAGGDTATMVLDDVSKRMTAAGKVLGTAPYMSPEQAKGQPVDHRSDIFSFGIVLYEMTTGKLPFHGDSVVTTVAKIIESEPEPVSGPIAAALPDLRRIITRCLRKAPEERFQSAADLALDLRYALEQPSGPQPAASPGEPQPREAPPRRRPLWWALPMLAVGALIGAIAVRGTADPAMELTPSQYRFVVDPAQAATTVVGNATSVGGLEAFAISPDGSTLAYALRDTDGGKQLFVQPLDSFAPRPLPGTEDMQAAMTFSPDGRWLAYAARGEKLKKVSILGGSPVTLCEGVNANALPAWLDDGTIVQQDPTSRILLRVPEDGGTPQRLVQLEADSELLGFENIAPMPNGNGLIGAVYTGNTIEHYEIIHISLAGEIRRLIPRATNPSPLSSGHLVFLRDYSLMAVPFDFDLLELGEPIAPVLEGVSTTRWGGTARYSLSSDGTLVFAPGERRAMGRRLIWLSPDGTIESITERDAFTDEIDLSPDGKKIAVSTLRRGHESWIYDLERDAMVPLNSEGEGYSFTWKHDSEEVSFYRLVPEEGYAFSHVVTRRLDSATPAERLPLEPANYDTTSWSPDGSTLLLQVRRETHLDLVAYHDGKLETILDSPHDECCGKFSPDGDWIVYGSTESGRNELYLQHFPADGRRWQLSSDGFEDGPEWSADGGSLYFVADDRMMALDLHTSPSVKIGKPRELFASPWPEALDRWDGWDVAPDGRFALIEPAAWELAPERLHVVVNWDREIPELLTTD